MTNPTPSLAPLDPKILREAVRHNGGLTEKTALELIAEVERLRSPPPGAGAADLLTLVQEGLDIMESWPLPKIGTMAAYHGTRDRMFQERKAYREKVKTTLSSLPPQPAADFEAFWAQKVEWHHLPVNLHDYTREVWAAAKAPTRPLLRRLLVDGEIIPPGAESLRENTNEWGPVDSWAVGRLWGKQFMPMRVPEPQGTQPDPTETNQGDA